jgi:hypothetical protein
MTKGQWKNIRIGTRVTTKLPDLANAMKSVNYYGTVVRVNGNKSQVLVRWGSGSEIWYGRLGIEIAQQLTTTQP